MKSILDKKTGKLISILFAAAGILLLILFFTADKEFRIDLMLSKVVAAAALFLIAAAFFFKDKLFLIIGYSLEIIWFLWMFMMSFGYDFSFFSHIPFLIRFWDTTDIITIFGSIIGCVIAAAAFAFLLIWFIKNSGSGISIMVAAGVMIAAQIMTGNIVESIPFVFVYFIPDNFTITTPEAKSPAAALSLEDELKDLKAKYELHQISEEEYNQKKSEILAKL